MATDSLDEHINVIEATVRYASLVRENGLPPAIVRAIGQLLARVKSMPQPGGVDVQALVRDLTAKVESLERELRLVNGEAETLRNAVTALDAQLAAAKADGGVCDELREQLDMKCARIRELEKALANDEAKPAKKTAKKGE